jgi:hypothetical protein
MTSLEVRIRSHQVQPEKSDIFADEFGGQSGWIFGDGRTFFLRRIRQAPEAR